MSRTTLTSSWLAACALEDLVRKMPLASIGFACVGLHHLSMNLSVSCVWQSWLNKNHCNHTCVVSHHSAHLNKYLFCLLDLIKDDIDCYDVEINVTFTDWKQFSFSPPKAENSCYLLVFGPITAGINFSEKKMYNIKSSHNRYMI